MWPLTCLLFLSAAALAQEPTDNERRPVPSEARQRVQLYFDLRAKKDWAKLYEVDDTEIGYKDDYIAMKVADETSPYIRRLQISEMRLSDSMLYRASSGKWQIDGCARFKDKDGVEKTAYGDVLIRTDPHDGILITNILPARFGDGWHECKQPLAKYPIVVELK